MGLIGDAITFGRFTLGLREYLSRRMSVADARAVLHRRLETRDDTFLGFLKKGFFENPRSPYRPLLELSGVQYGDVEKMVRARGIEATLEELYDAGVYVTFEELKGRRPVVRDGRELPIKAGDFGNPYLCSCYQGQTSGSTGAGTRVSIDLEHLWDQMPIKVLLCDAHGISDVPTACWRPIPPATSGLSNVLRGPIVGNPLERWFTPVTARDARTALKYRLATRWTLAVARLWGYRLPKPERVPLDEPGPVVDWVADALQRRGACHVSAFISMGLRVATAARERGLDLTGVTFRGGGEPPTPGKVAAIEATGARWVPTYGTTESGQIGAPCAAPLDGNDLHVLRDRVALVQRPYEVPGWGLTVKAFFVTTLTPSSPRLMLNAGIDDYGILEDRKCGCPFEEFGYGPARARDPQLLQAHGRGADVAGDRHGQHRRTGAARAVRRLAARLPAHGGGGRGRRDAPQPRRQPPDRPARRAGRRACRAGRVADGPAGVRRGRVGAGRVVARQAHGAGGGVPEASSFRSASPSG